MLCVLPCSTYTRSPVKDSDDVECLLLRQCISRNSARRTSANDSNATDFGGHNECLKKRSSLNDAELVFCRRTQTLNTFAGDTTNACYATLRSLCHVQISCNCDTDCARLAGMAFRAHSSTLQHRKDIHIVSQRTQSGFKVDVADRYTVDLSMP